MCRLRCVSAAATAAPLARAANFVKKPPLIVNVTYLESNGFNAPKWVSWHPTDSKKSHCIDQCIQIHQICVNKHWYDIKIKFEVSLHFWPIWPTVRRTVRRSAILPPCRFFVLNRENRDVKKSLTCNWGLLINCIVYRKSWKASLSAAKTWTKVV